MTTYREARSNSRSARKKNVTQKSSTLPKKLKELAAEAEDNEEIVSALIPQDDSENSDELRDYIIANSTIIPVLIWQTGYTSPTIVHSLETFPLKKDMYNLTKLGSIGKMESENDVVWITLQAHQFK